MKLWAARGTLYVLPSAELGMWLSALGTQTTFGNTEHPKIDVLADAVGRALKGRILTREELALAIVDSGFASLPRRSCELHRCRRRSETIAEAEERRQS